MVSDRPVGVVVLGFLSILGGIINVLWGIAVSGISGVSWFGGVIFSDSLQHWGSSTFVGSIFGIFGGVLQIVVGVGLLSYKTWAWILAIISAGWSLLHAFWGLVNGNFWNLFSLIIPGIIVIYLMQENVREAFFGRAQ